MTTPSKNHETHAACGNRLEKYGRDAYCCICTPHDTCNLLNEAPPKKRDVVEEEMQAFEDSLAEILEEKFPKLNADDTTKPSPNNRSQALTLYAQACVLHRASLHRVQREERGRVLEVIEERKRIRRYIEEIQKLIEYL